MEWELIVAAGVGMDGTANTSYYLYNPSAWSWSMTPATFNNDIAFIFTANIYGSYDSHFSLPGGGTASPVINLSAGYVKTLSGTGTLTDPYQISQ